MLSVRVTGMFSQGNIKACFTSRDESILYLVRDYFFDLADSPSSIVGVDSCHATECYVTQPKGTKGFSWISVVGFGEHFHATRSKATGKPRKIKGLRDTLVNVWCN